jgi:hypothetical protein
MKIIEFVFISSDKKIDSNINKWYYQFISRHCIGTIDYTVLSVISKNYVRIVSRLIDNIIYL